jgi:hypothetical protein
MIRILRLFCDSRMELKCQELPYSGQYISPPSLARERETLNLLSNSFRCHKENTSVTSRDMHISVRAALIQFRSPSHKASAVYKMSVEKNSGKILQSLTNLNQSPICIIRSNSVQVGLRDMFRSGDKSNRQRFTALGEDLFLLLRRLPLLVP